MKKFEYVLLVIVLLGALLVRLYRIDSPIGDWHSWRQADTSSVSRNFTKFGFDILHPRFDDLSKSPSRMDNPQGYRFVEFPIYNVAQAGLYKAFGIFTLEKWGRLVTIFATLASIVFLYLLVKKHGSIQMALYSSLFFAFVPFNIYYGRTILPDPSMVAASLAGIWFFDQWIDLSSKLKTQSSKLQLKSCIYLVLGILFTAVAFLLKPFALFFTLPMIYLAYKAWGFGLLKKWQLWIFTLVSLLPLVLWRQWMQQYPEGIPQNAWLFNYNGIRFRPAFFRWIFYERITKLISGYFMAPIIFVGLIASLREKSMWFFFSFFAASLLYMCVIATGSVQHDYYQILIIPSLSILYGLGVYVITEQFPKFIPRQVLILFVVLLSVSGFVISWGIVKEYFNINKMEIVLAGKAADQLTPKDAKIIAPYGGDTAFLYQTNRQGWPVFDRELEEFLQAGATYMVFVTPTDAELNFQNQYKTVKKTKDYILYDITKPLK